MKCAYEAANGVEAHMIANLLEQQHIHTRIDGEHLAGGVGDLPAMGLVRVMVNEEDHLAARGIIQEWEAISPPPVTDAKPAARSLAPAWFVLGAVAGVTVMTWVDRARTVPEGVDFNEDGRWDQTYSYLADHLSKVEGDANLDGRVDYEYEYDAQGIAKSGRVDIDFDGQFEAQLKLERGRSKLEVIDADMDGAVDYRHEYVNGVLQASSSYAPASGRLVKREHFEDGMRVSAEFDADGDGAFDTFYKYDRYGEIVETRYQ